MKQDIQELLNQAKVITLKNKKSAGTRYPKRLKTIINTLINVHGLSSDDVVTFVPVSKLSVQRWSETGQEKVFKKVTVKKESPRPKRKFINRDFHIILVAVQILLISAQLFLH